MTALGRFSVPRVTSLAAQSCVVRPLCVNLRKADGNAQDAWFAKQEREQLEKLKASLAKKKKPIAEADEKVRLQKIIEAVGVREQIREELPIAIKGLPPPSKGRLI